MLAVVVNIHEAKTQLSRLLQRVATGERVIIAKSGTPIADLVPDRADISFGSMQGRLAYSDTDLEAVDPEVAAMFYGDEP